MSALPLSAFLPNVSSIAYGCMGLGGGWNNEAVHHEHYAQANRIIDTCLEHGINFFDHADIYTYGKAETVFGHVLSERNGLREQMFIQSKCGIRFEDELGPKRYDFSRKWLLQSVDGILARLRCEYLDVLLLHRPDPLMEPQEVAEALAALGSSGKVRYVGVSNMHLHQMVYLQSNLHVPLVVNQLEISLQKRHWIEEAVLAGNTSGSHINFTGGTIEYCRQNNIQLQAWGALCQGLFSGRDVSAQSESVKCTAAYVKALSQVYQVSREAIVLGWLMRHPARVQPVVGTTDLDRITGAAQAMHVSLSREEWYSLFATARGEELP